MDSHEIIQKKCFDFVNDRILAGDLCYAGSRKDDETIKQLFKTATPNPDPNKFPDFICKNGFIEHFEVTSSHSNRNGSTMKREKDKLLKEAEAKENALKAEMDTTPCYEGKTIITDKWHSKHSYDDFCLSFKRAWQHHIDSLEKFDGNKSIGIFMIQYNDLALCLDAIFPDVKTEIYYGDLLERPDYGGYRLTHDSNMLEYIYQFKEKIQYVAFFNNDGWHGKRCEVICVENIPEILKIIKGNYRFHCAMVGTSYTTYGISIPNPIIEGNDENDQT